MGTADPGTTGNLPKLIVNLIPAHLIVRALEAMPSLTINFKHPGRKEL